MKTSKMLFAMMGVAGLALVSTQTASAALLPITNASFEADIPNTYPSVPIGWTRSCIFSWMTPSSVVEGDGFVTPHVAPADGNQHLTLGPKAIFTSNDTFVLTSGDIGSVVTLTVAIGNRAGLTSQAPSDATIGIQLDATDVASAALAVFPAEGGWLDLSATYTVTAGDVGKALGVRIVDVGGGYFDNNRVEADNVRLDVSAAPEPASLSLLGLSSLLLVARRRK